MERFLPDVQFRGGAHSKLRHVLYLPAVVRGGVEPDLLDEVAWWNTDDFWSYAIHVLAIYLRLTAEHLENTQHVIGRGQPTRSTRVGARPRFARDVEW